MTSHCVNHVYTLPPKLSSLIIKFGSGLIVYIFASVASNLIGNDDEYEKTHTKITDSVCKDLKTSRFKVSLFVT